jgi:hypothetical protein
MTSADEIRDVQRATWAGLSAGWEKWSSVIMDQWARSAQRLPSVRTSLKIISISTQLRDPSTAAVGERARPQTGAAWGRLGPNLRADGCGIGRCEHQQGDHYEGQFEGQNGASVRLSEPVSARVS